MKNSTEESPGSKAWEYPLPSTETPCLSSCGIPHLACAESYDSDRLQLFSLA